MIYFVALGRWNHAAGRWFARERIWWRGHCWTPFVKVKWRYPWDSWPRWIANRLPRQIVYFAVVRAWNDATTGQWSDEEASSVRAIDLLKRWQEAPQTHDACSPQCLPPPIYSQKGEK